MTGGGRLAVAVELDGDGAHPASWRAAAHPPAALLSPARLRETVPAAERYGFSIATFEDAVLAAGRSPDVTARLDAVQRAAYAAPLTSGIGLLPVAHVVYSEPFHVATQLASIDHVSYGRAGWIVAASGLPAEAAAFGREPVTDPGALRREAEDVVEVARRLWDSWEDDAVIRDVETGRYLDRSKLHYPDFAGATFSVRAPSIIPRPPQGQLVVAAPAGLVSPARADVALVTGPTIDETLDAARRARADGYARVFAELEVALDAQAVPAAERLRRLDAHTAWAASGRARHVGDARGLAERIGRLSTVVDGVRLHPAVIDVDLHEIGREVLPILRHEHGFSSPRPGDTLRETLGLERPANRYATAV